MRLIDDKAVVCIGGDLRKTERGTEQLIDVGELFRLVPGEDGQEGLSGRAVLRNVCGIALTEDELHQQIDRQYRFAGPRPALNDDRTFFMVFQALEHGPDTHVEADGLLVQKIEYRRPPNHGCKGILQGFGRLDPAVVYQVKEVSMRRFPGDVPFDEADKRLRLIHDEKWSGSVPLFVDLV